MADLVTEVETATAVIVKNVENVLDRIHSEAEAASERITVGATTTVAGIKEETTKAAAKLLRDVETGEDEKSAARAAGRILEEATVTSIKLKQRAEKAIASIAEKVDVAVANVNRSLEDAVRDLVELGQNAVLKADEEGKEAAAKAIESLARATEKVNRVAEEATAKLHKAAEEAIELVEKAAREATVTIERAIDDANEKIFEVTESAIVNAVGAEEVEYFDIDALKKKWGRKDG
ncbi:MAG: hypothetical protein HQ512_00265 [Rhodospirillales bacterium]|nr:hypothetical protein [Rhodospirillales bacterium]